MILTIIFSSVALSLIYFIYWYFYSSVQYQHKQCSIRGIKSVVMKSILTLMYNRVREEFVMMDYIKQNGKLFGFSFVNSLTIVTVEPELIQSVLSKEFATFMNRRDLKFNDKFLDNVLSMAEGEKWKRLRTIVSPTFATGKLRRMKPLIDESLVVFLNNFDTKLTETNVVDLRVLVGSFTMDTIIRVAFGRKMDSLSDPNNPIIFHVNKLFSLDFSPLAILGFLVVLFCPSIAKKLGLRFQKKSVDFFYDLSKDIIEQKRIDFEQKKSSTNKDKASNFIELLIEAEAEVQQSEKAETNSGKASKYITNEEMLAQCVLFFIAGYDTTATTISTSCYYLANNPEKQNILYQEIVSEIQKLKEESNETDICKLVTFESLSRFEYLNAVIKESLRLTPPASIIERRAENDIKLETNDGKIKLNVKKNDIIYIPIYTLHRDPVQFPDPEQFKPERFIGEPTFHNYAYLPFGSGPRSCVAKSLGLLEAKLALLHLIYRYQMDICNETAVPLEYMQNSFILTPSNIRLKVTKRN